jgi:predicted TPR repeat methyltransferase
VSDNSAQIEYWNGKAGATWVAAQQRMDAMLAEFTATAIGKADASAGERVIDVGCGCGDTSIALAERGASVWGIDISEPMLARARERAGGHERLAFSQVDAAVAEFTADHDLIFSRFGVMFFAEPHAAFANLASALSPGGRLVFLCWQAAAENAWVATAGRAVQPFLPVPETRPDPRAPGPFAFAEQDYVDDILRTAGFSDICIEPVTARLNLGATLDEAMALQGEIGPMARVLAELEDQRRDDALAAARQALKAHLTDSGVLLDAACWLVSAKR